MSEQAERLRMLATELEIDPQVASETTTYNELHQSADLIDHLEAQITELVGTRLESSNRRWACRLCPGCGHIRRHCSCHHKCMFVFLAAIATVCFLILAVAHWL